MYTRLARSDDGAGVDARMPSQRRTTAVTKWLLQGKKLRAKACAQQLGISQRSFYNMMEVVSLELPIVNVKGDWFITQEARAEMGVAQNKEGKIS